MAFVQQSTLTPTINVQRSGVQRKKQLLVDSVLRGYDVPKFYWMQVSKKPAKFDVVDGQQRIRAICEFCDGKYGLPKDAEAIDGNSVAGLKYQELPFDLRIKWDTYNLDVVVMDDARRSQICPKNNGRLPPKRH
jgi:uncharacterized protein DUF262